jgi:hypothetical protein
MKKGCEWQKNTRLEQQLFTFQTINRKRNCWFVVDIDTSYYKVEVVSAKNKTRPMFGWMQKVLVQSYKTFYGRNL